MPPSRAFEFTARCFLRLLLESMDENNPPAGEEEIDNAVNVGVAFFAEFLQITVEMPDERFSRLNIADTQLFH